MPIVTVRAMSRQEARERLEAGAIHLAGHDETWVVSIRSPGADPLPFAPSPLVVEVQFGDWDPDQDDDPDRSSPFRPPRGRRHEIVQAWQADAIAAHIALARARPGRVALLAHCDAGVCRSGAVVHFAAALAGIPPDQVMRDNPLIDPNRTVYRMLAEARRRGASEPSEPSRGG
jgi:predicted protein tyrosine phosphatase